MNGHLRVAIDHPSGVGDARRSVVRLCQEASWSDIDSGKAAIVATELATNLIKHAARGWVLARMQGGELELISIDKGPGIASIERSIVDGYSTAGSPGTGLGAIERASSRFEIWSQPGDGTVVLSRIQRGPSPPTSPSLRIGGISVPYPGELVAGDAWALRPLADGVLLLVVDGLGHGPQAADAARAATDAFLASRVEDPEPLIEGLHQALRPTRGAAVGVLLLRPEAGTVSWAGVGNVAARVVGVGVQKNLISYEGICGHMYRTVRTIHDRLPPNARVVVHSDGISTRWDLARWPTAAHHDPSVTAALLLRDHGRDRDDATVVVLTEQGAST